MRPRSAIARRFAARAAKADLSVSALKRLREDGIAIPDGKPAAISPEDVAAATHIFAIGCTLPANAQASGKAGDWSDVPEDRGYAATREASRRHVEQLLDDLVKSHR